MKTKVSVATGRLRNAPVAEEAQHFHPKGKIPSKYTIEAQHRQRKTLPSADNRDFEEAKRGFVVGPLRLPRRPARRGFEGSRKPFDAQRRPGPFRH